MAKAMVMRNPMFLVDVWKSSYVLSGILTSKQPLFVTFSPFLYYFPDYFLLLEKKVLQKGGPYPRITAETFLVDECWGVIHQRT